MSVAPAASATPPMMEVDEDIPDVHIINSAPERGVEQDIIPLYTKVRWSSLSDNKRMKEA